VDLRGRVLYTGHTLDFAIPVPQSTVSDQVHPDKAQLRSSILGYVCSGHELPRNFTGRRITLDALQQIVKPEVGIR
jgi:hypothetical protein